MQQFSSLRDPNQDQLPGPQKQVFQFSIAFEDDPCKYRTINYQAGAIQCNQDLLTMTKLEPIKKTNEVTCLKMELHNKLTFPEASPDATQKPLCENFATVVGCACPR